MTTSNTPIYASQARPWLKFYDQKYIDQTMPACTAFELVCRQNKNRLGETALEYYGRKFTYADFIVNVKKTAAALRAAGLKKRNMAGRCGGGRVHQRRLRGRRGGKRCGGAVQCVAQRQLVEQQAIHRRVVGQQQIEQALCVGGVAGFAGVRGGDGCARPCCGW